MRAKAGKLRPNNEDANIWWLLKELSDVALIVANLAHESARARGAAPRPEKVPASGQGCRGSHASGDSPLWSSGGRARRRAVRPRYAAEVASGSHLPLAAPICCGLARVSRLSALSG